MSQFCIKRAITSLFYVLNLLITVHYVHKHGCLPKRAILGNSAKSASNAWKPKDFQNHCVYLVLYADSGDGCLPRGRSNPPNRSVERVPSDWSSRKQRPEPTT